ncbi:MAG: preprotein translocase subunit SecG [Acidobacteriota bacterium]
MLTLLIIFHLLAAMILILVIMLQSGKAGDLSSAFGGANSQTAFGARGATTVLTKITTVCAVLFVSTSLGLAIIYSQDNSTSVMQDSPGTETVDTQEATPGETAPALPDESSDQAPGSDDGTEN